MCGIIGILGKNAEVVRQPFVDLLLQSRIRGKHATGISYNDGDKLVTIKEPIPADEFVKHLPVDLGKLIIGHVRYSTSNIDYNQPLTEGEISLVHNGVITQAPFEQWSKLYNIPKFNTKNDSEILLKYILLNRKLIDFKDSSIACGFVARKDLYCYRNTKRPLFLFKTENFVGFASTHNIIKRAIKQPCEIILCLPYVAYKLNNDLSYSVFEQRATNEKDLQYNTVNSVHYLAGGRIAY